MEIEEVAGIIVDGAAKVLISLGPGLLEAAYQIKQGIKRMVNNLPEPRQKDMSVEER